MNRSGVASGMHPASVALIVAGLLGSFTPAEGQPARDWWMITSSNLEVLTDGGEQIARAVAARFEQIRQLFSDSTGAGEGGLLPFRVPMARLDTSARQSKVPLRVIVFAVEKDFRPYGFADGERAYSARNANRDYIVMSRSGSESLATAIHEYMHILLRDSGAILPVWVREGVAELYSTTRPVEQGLELGGRITQHCLILQRQQLLDLKTLSEIQRDSPYYRQSNLSQLFYAESWALVHMLSLSREYTLSQFGDFLQQLSRGESHETAFQEIYGKSMREIQRELQRYVQVQKFSLRRFKTELQPAVRQAEVRPVGDLERDKSLAELLVLVGRYEEARHRYDALARVAPEDWEVVRALGFLALRNQEKCR